MKVSSIVSELTDLERKRDEISNVLTESAYGEASVVLDRELDFYRKKVDTYLNADFEPTSTVVYLGAVNPSPTLAVGESAQLEVTATFGDGTTKDLTEPLVSMMLFRDFDKLADNVGFITSVVIESYKGEEVTLEIVKTSTGFTVTDSLRTQGLEIAPTLLPNEFNVVDKEGNSIGIVLTTDGNETIGDNWLLDIYWSETGTSYEISDSSIAVVDAYGLVTVVGGGTAIVTVRNGELETAVTVTASDSVAPSPPKVKTVTPIVEGASVAFDASISVDVDFYNIYVNNVLKLPNVHVSPTDIALVADGFTPYSVSMTATDFSGNESVKSQAVVVVPLESI